MDKTTTLYTVRNLHENGKLLWYKKDSIRGFIDKWKLKAEKKQMWPIEMLFISEDEVKRFCKKHTKHAAQKLWVKKTWLKKTEK